MELLLLRIFQGQVELQCRFMLQAAEDANKGLQNADTTQIWYALQNLLNASANISKTLWGSGGKLAEQRKLLRNSIGITDSSPLRDVTMRNHFEHYDERIDKWWNKSTDGRHHFIDKLVGPKNMIRHDDPTNIFRHFEPTSTDLVFWGQEYNIQALINEVHKILPKLQEEIGRGLDPERQP